LVSLINGEDVEAEVEATEEEEEEEVVELDFEAGDTIVEAFSVVVDILLNAGKRLADLRRYCRNSESEEEGRRAELTNRATDEEEDDEVEIEEDENTAPESAE
jgi:hypothetical protein